MADWLNISDAQVDPDAPITSELGYAFRDNPIAIAEGATGAPRITQAAIMNPTAGTFRTITNCSGTVPAVAESSSLTLYRFSFITPGTVRFRTVISNIGGSGGIDPTIAIARVRNGNIATLVSYDTVGTRADDFTFQIGDVVRAVLSAPGTRGISGESAILIGNDAVTGCVIQ